MEDVAGKMEDAVLISDLGCSISELFHTGRSYAFLNLDQCGGFRVNRDAVQYKVVAGLTSLFLNFGPVVRALPPKFALY
jgi:hypothetical protein